MFLVAEDAWHFGGVEIIEVGDFEDFTDIYQLVPGDIFHLDIHEYFVELIKKRLEDEGFLNASLIQEFVRDKAKKKVFVKLRVELGQPFTVSRVEVRLYGRVGRKPEKLRCLICEMLSRLVVEKTYKKTLVEGATEEALCVLAKKGLRDIDISFRRRNDFEFATTDLIFEVCVGHGDIALLKAGREFLDTEKFEDSLLKNVLKSDCSGEIFKRVNFTSGANGSFFAFGSKPVYVRFVSVMDSKGIAVPFIGEKIASKLSRKQLNRSTLEKVCSGMTKHFVERGFWDFCVKKVHLDPVTENACDVMMHLYFGPRRVFSSAKIFPRSVLKKIPELNDFCIVRSNAAQLCNPFELERIRADITNVCRTAGYWDSSVSAKIEEIREGEGWINVFVKYFVNLGSKLKFGKVRVKGSCEIPVEKLKGMLHFSEGDEWDFRKLRNSKSCLGKLGVFKDVQFFCGAENLKHKSLPVDVILTSDLPYEAKLRVGGKLCSSFKKNDLKSILSGSTFELGCSMVAKNFSGRADKICTNIDVCKSQQTAEILYQCPRPSGLPFLFSTKAYVSRSFGFVQGKFRLGNFHLGCSAGINRDWIQGITSFLFCGCEVLSHYDSTESKFRHWSPHIFSHAGFAVDKLSGDWTSREGVHLALGFAGALPFETYPAKIAFCADISFFKRTFGTCVFVVRGRMCASASSYTDDVVREYGSVLEERWNEDKKYTFLFPPTDDHSYVSWKEKGGIINGIWDTATRECSVYSELRLPVYEAIWSTVFAGILSANFKGWDFADNLLSLPLGLGLCFATPIGMIHADVGCDIAEKSGGKNSWFWRLAIGQIF
ncbi:hypothetical protein ACFLY6_02000 [Candidatus Dependentiae bacterium]